jgi:hypothetical protein
MQIWYFTGNFLEKHLVKLATFRVPGKVNLLIIQLAVISNTLLSRALEWKR